MTLRADLHVHTRHSTHNGTMPFLGARDCYSTPRDVYRVAKSRGMDLVAITDHDSIDGALELLDERPDAEDVIVGEEITCRMPGGGVEVHIGAYGMTESLHRDVQRAEKGRLRRDGDVCGKRACSSPSIICCISIAARCRSSRILRLLDDARRSRCATGPWCRPTTSWSS